MFGFSFGELVVLMIVAVVVIGPKELPKVLRRMGQWAAKLRRMASDIRVQSGIDDVLRGEGIAEDIAEIRKLARGEMDNVTRATRLDMTSAIRRDDPYGEARDPGEGLMVVRDREYPREGADSYGALPDTSLVFDGSLPASPLATDPLYRTGDPNGVVPPPPSAAPSEEAPPAATAGDASPTEPA